MSCAACRVFSMCLLLWFEAHCYLNLHTTSKQQEVLAKSYIAGTNMMCQGFIYIHPKISHYVAFSGLTSMHDYLLPHMHAQE